MDISRNRISRASSGDRRRGRRRRPAVGLWRPGRGRFGTTTVPRSADVTPACVVTPEGPEGPFYTAVDLVRRDISEGRPGAPLDLRLRVVDAEACEPIPDAGVDVWHAGAGGLNSAFVGQGESADIDTTEQTFLRGVHSTGEDGEPPSRRSIRGGTRAAHPRALQDPPRRPHPGKVPALLPGPDHRARLPVRSPSPTRTQGHRQRRRRARRRSSRAHHGGCARRRRLPGEPHDRDPAMRDMAEKRRRPGAGSAAERT